MTTDTGVVQPVSVSPGTVCPHCGQDVSLPASSADNVHDLQAAQQRIQELEAQVKFLTTRAAATGMCDIRAAMMRYFQCADWAGIYCLQPRNWLTTRMRFVPFAPRPEP